MSALTILYIVMLVGLPLIGVVALLVFLRQMATTRAEAMKRRFPGARVLVPNANFFGQESKGVAQIRGSGTLVVTDNEIVFEKWVPRTEYSIRLDSIERIETPSAYLTKTVGAPLLKVVFRDGSGNLDSMAWWVHDLEGLKALLENR